MPSYRVLDPAVLDAATLATQSTSDERAAVQAVPAVVDLPGRVIVVDEAALLEFMVSETTNETPPPVVVRSRQPLG